MESTQRQSMREFLQGLWDDAVWFVGDRIELILLAILASIFASIR